MRKKTAYSVVIRRPAGDKSTLKILADNAESASRVALMRARRAQGTSFADRKYGTFAVVSCLPM